MASTSELYPREGSSAGPVVPIPVVWCRTVWGPSAAVLHYVPQVPKYLTLNWTTFPVSAVAASAISDPRPTSSLPVRARAAHPPLRSKPPPTRRAPTPSITYYSFRLCTFFNCSHRTALLPDGYILALVTYPPSLDHTHFLITLTSQLLSAPNRLGIIHPLLYPTGPIASGPHRKPTPWLHVKHT